MIASANASHNGTIAHGGKKRRKSGKKLRSVEIISATIIFYTMKYNTLRCGTVSALGC